VAGRPHREAAFAGAAARRGAASESAGDFRVRQSIFSSKDEPEE